MLWTIPNVICLLRIAGTLALVGLAIVQEPFWFVRLYVVLGISDLVDGPLARRFGQSSDVGAVLDSVADVLLSGCLVIGAAILCWAVVKGELAIIVTAVTSWLVATGLCFWKFRRIPSFHTYSAKLTHLLVAIAGVSLVLGWSVWPLRVASLAVVATNVESIAITASLEKWRSDVPSIFVLGKKDDSSSDRHSTIRHRREDHRTRSR